jgi:hypothetical protein
MATTIRVEAHYPLRDGDPTYATGTLTTDIHGTPVLDLERKHRTIDPRHMGRYSAAGSRNLRDEVVIVSPPATREEEALIESARAAGFAIAQGW